MSTNSWLTIMSLQPAGGQGRLSSGFQTPDRSGLPSSVRGAGAERSTAPLFVRGTFAVGYLTHCAPSVTAIASTSAAATIVRLMCRILDETPVHHEGTNTHEGHEYLFEKTNRVLRACSCLRDAQEPLNATLPLKATGRRLIIPAYGSHHTHRQRP